MSDLRPMREKTLYELEGIAAPDRAPTDRVERTRDALRRTPIGALTPGELRRALRYRVGIRYVTRLAVEQLEADPLVETTFGPGDLLRALLEVDAYWLGEPALRDLRPRVRAIVACALERLGRIRPTEWGTDALPDPDELSEHDRAALEPILRDALKRLP